MISTRAGLPRAHGTHFEQDSYSIEGGQIAGEIDRADRRIEDHEAAGSEHSADVGQGVEVDRQVEMLVFQRAGGDAAGLDTFECVSVAHPAPDLFDESAQRDAHWHFDQAHRLERPLDGHHLGAGALFGSDLGVPLAAVVDDVADVRDGFGVVGDGWALPDPFFDRSRRLGARLTAHTHHGVHQRRAFAADVRAAAGANPECDILAGAEHVFADQTQSLGVGDGLAESLDRQRVLTANVVVGPLGADRDRRRSAALRGSGADRLRECGDPCRRSARLRGCCRR